MTRATPKPTDAELAILRVLWDRGPSTVRQVHDVLGREDVIVKPLGPLFADVSGIAGATVTGDGRLALVMDLAGLAGGAGQLFTALQLAG